MTDKEKASIRDLLKTADINLSERQTNILCRAWELSLTKVYEQGLAEGRNEQRRLQIAYSEVLEKENAELKKMFDFICRQRFGYAWNMNKDVYIADIKKALKGEKTQWV